MSHSQEPAYATWSLSPARTSYSTPPRWTTAPRPGPSSRQRPGFNPAQATSVLHMLASGEWEDVRPDETVALVDDTQKFIIVESDRLYRFTVDGERFDWPVRIISGATVRKLAKVPDDQGAAARARGSPRPGHRPAERSRPGSRGRRGLQDAQAALGGERAGRPVISDAPSIVARDAIARGRLRPRQGLVRSS